MRINITKFDGNSYYSQVGIPTTRQERKFLKELKYDLIDEYGSMELAKAPVGFHNWTQEEYSQHLDYLDSLIGDV